MTMAVTHEIKKYKIYVKTPYDQGFVNAVRNLKTRHYENDGVNSISMFCEEDIIALNNLVKRFYNVDLNLNPNIAKTKPFGAARVSEGKVIFKTVMYDERFNEDLKKTFKNYHFNGNDQTWSVFIGSNTNLNNFLHFNKMHRIVTRKEFNDEYMVFSKHYIEMKMKREELVKASSNSCAPDDFAYNLPDPVLSLFPFQEAGVYFLKEVKGNGLVADEQGLGKTVQVLVYLFNEPSKRPVLFIVPGFVKMNWCKEMKKWMDVTDNDIHYIEGQKACALPDKSLYIINYEILQYWLDELMKIGFKCLVFDESHKIKNYKAKRSISAITLSRKINSVICLTGTPILNKPIEIWTTIKLLKHEAEFGNVGLFLFKYCGAFHDENNHLITDGASNIDELQVKLRSGIMIRRTKKDVLKDLPSKNRMMMEFDLDNQAEYDKVKNDFENWYKIKTGKTINDAEAVVQVEMLKQASANGKLNGMNNFILETIENDDKVVVFAHHKKVIASIIESLTKKKVPVFKVVGGETPEQKSDQVDKFNASKTGVCVCSLKGGSEGINLQTASTVIFTELGWTPGEHDQAEDRIHRIGQDHVCNIYYCIAPNTIDGIVWKVLKNKRDIIEKSIDGMVVEDEGKKGFIKEVIEEMRKQGC